MIENSSCCERTMGARDSNSRWLFSWKNNRLLGGEQYVARGEQ